MAEGFSDSSTQCAVLYNLGYSAEAGSTVTVKDAAGREILNYTVPCAFSSVSLSSPDMKLGETYTVTVGDKEQEITLDSVSTIVGSTSGGMGGMGGWGRDQRQRDSADGSERPENGERPAMGGWGAQPDGTGENENAMPAPPESNGEMPDFTTMPAPPDMSGMQPGMNGETPDPSQMPQGMGGGHMRRDEMPDAMQNAAEEAAELAIEEPVPIGPQPVSASTWQLLAACAAALALGILIAVKYRQ